MFTFSYLDSATPLHKLDPRVKILAMLCLSGASFVFNDPRYVAVVTIVLLCLAALGRCLAGVLRFKWFFLIVFVVNAVLWQFYVSGGSTLLRLGPLHVTHDGSLYALAVALRFVNLLIVGVIFVSSAWIEEIIAGLGKLHTPYAVSFVITMTFRLVPTFVSGARTIMEAQVARGLDTTTRNPVKKMRQAFPVMVPMIMYALRYVSFMALALEARGFTPGMRRTSYTELSLTARDICVGIAIPAILVACIGLRVAGYGVVLTGRI